MNSLAGLRWLLPAALYDAAGLAEPARDPHARTDDSPASPVCHVVVDGAGARALDAALRDVLPDGMRPCRREDFGDGSGTAATIRYRGPRGGFLRVTRRRLSRPLLLDAFVDAGHDDAVRVRSTGTDVIAHHDDAADVHRLVMIRPNGTLLVVESIGLPGAGTPAPISHDELDVLAARLDDPRSDLEPAA